MIIITMKRKLQFQLRLRSRENCNDKKIFLVFQKKITEKEKKFRNMNMPFSDR